MATLHSNDIIKTTDTFTKEMLIQLGTTINKDPRLYRPLKLNGSKTELKKQIFNNLYVFPEILVSALEKVTETKDEGEDNDEEDKESNWDPATLRIYDPGKEKDPGFNFEHSGIKKEKFDKIIKSIRSYYEYKRNPRKLPIPIKNLNILLHGKPGSGKTEFAKNLSHLLNKKIILISYSDILSRWVGESEFRLSRLFKFAQENSLIIFFDEFEALCLNSSFTDKSHEISTAGQFIKDLEDFEGVFIGATNYPERLDGRTKRRLAISAEFGYLDKKGIEHFFKTYLAPIIHNPNQGAEMKLMNLKNLTPGDFLVCYKRFVFLESSAQEVINEMIKISKEKGEL